MQETDGDIAARARVIFWIANLTWIGGLVVFAAIGLIGRQVLVGQGVAVLSWQKSLAYFVPFALLHDAPVALYAFVLYRGCLRGLRGQPAGASRYLLKAIAPPFDPARAEDFAGLIHAVTGSCLAVVGIMGYSLFGSVLYTGPGGFGEAATMILVMSPLVFAHFAVVCLIAAIIGGILGSLVYKVMHRSPDAGPGAP